MAKYLIAGDKLFALNLKVATSSFTRAIISRYYPDLELRITSAHYPEGLTANNQSWQNIVPYRTTADRPVVCLVRDPVERFRSAMAQMQLTDVDAAITELQTEAGAYGAVYNTAGNVVRKLVENPHFTAQSLFTGNPIDRYRFPDQIEAAAAALDLPFPLPSINEMDSGLKPTLTETQVAAVREFYAADVALWESLS